ncbi:flavodoxin family protein [Actinocatenispora sera]|uniref:Flavodoxin n=1 Tax=Actinocatenispora sera TaxID=390989 RepID=A0A810L8F7_9ACTN|nr:flavodoxin domain-containing protein [Actinocatenispora sera]BCJ31814.1 flavodoxin [Actinocatenispora sera]
MRALVVYESMFGDTEQVARALAEGLGTRAAVQVSAVGDAPAPVPDAVDLLVVGGPTHAFGMSRPNTRNSAARQSREAVGVTERGVREWLAEVGSLRGRLAAAFDTHARTRLPGSAAAGIDRRLRRLGARTIAPAHSFYVTDTQGPLADGERDRALRWGVDLAEAAAATLGSGRTSLSGGSA